MPSVRMAYGHRLGQVCEVFGSHFEPRNHHSLYQSTLSEDYLFGNDFCKADVPTASIVIEKGQGPKEHRVYR
jgi:hypothetical protein